MVHNRKSLPNSITEVSIQGVDCCLWANMRSLRKAKTLIWGLQEFSIALGSITKCECFHCSKFKLQNGGQRHAYIIISNKLLGYVCHLKTALICKFSSSLSLCLGPLYIKKTFRVHSLTTLGHFYPFELKKHSPLRGGGKGERKQTPVIGDDGEPWQTQHKFSSSFVLSQPLECVPLQHVRASCSQFLSTTARRTSAVVQTTEVVLTASAWFMGAPSSTTRIFQPRLNAVKLWKEEAG